MIGPDTTFNELADHIFTDPVLSERVHVLMAQYGPSKKRGLDREIEEELNLLMVILTIGEELGMGTAPALADHRARQAKKRKRQRRTSR